MDCRQLLNTTTYRKLLLLEILFKKGEQETTDLLTELACTLPVLLRDIKQINASYTILSVEKNNGFYQLNKDEGVGLSQVYAKVIQEAPEFQILEKLLYEEHNTLTELAQALFISVPNTQRIIEKLKKHLKPLHINISNRPLRIDGDERMVRHLYYRFFTERSPNVTCDLPRLNPLFQELMKDYVKAFISENQLDFVYVFFQRLVYNFYISCWRLKNQHFMPIELLNAQVAQLPSGSVAAGASFLMKDQFGLSLNSQTGLEVFWLVYADCLVFSKDQLNHSLTNNRRLQRNYQSFQQLVKKYTRLFPEEVRPKQVELNQLALLLHNATFLYPEQVDHLDIIARCKLELVAQVSKRHPEIIKKLRELVENHLLQSGPFYLQDDFINTMIYWLVTGIPESLALLEQSQDKLQILIVSTNSPTEEIFIAHQIQEKIHGYYQLKTKKDCQPDLQQMMKNCDLVLATSALANLPKQIPSMQVNSFLDWSDLERIQQKVNRLMVKKGTETPQINRVKYQCSAK